MSGQLKDHSPQRRGGTEFFIVNGACGAVNNTKFFSVPPRLCGEALLKFKTQNAHQY